MNRAIRDTSTEQAGDRASQWPAFAAKWQLLGPPLRPAPQDVRLYEDAVQEWTGRRDAPRVLLLGVTPELYRLPWPEGTDFLAVDRTQAMIDAVWPGPSDAVLRANWFEMALPDDSRDIALCDGSLNLLSFPREQPRLVNLLRGVLAEGGLFVCRLFVPPARPETTEMILEDLMAGKIPNLNVLKLKLWMALQKSFEEGVRLATVWRVIREAAPDFERLASTIGWPVEHLLAVNAYRNSTERYHFGTVDQVTDMFRDEPGGFEVVSVRSPDYDCGEQCPTFVFRRR